ncbi:MAG TPA: T9SS type A sorting domain-containing protein [Sediminibacterium sp.]|nr:T9SS type A sorting domain-containing protein [Sediminibacterium sp.]
MKNPVLLLIVIVIVLFSLQAAGQDSSQIHRKIPIDAKRWYQLTNASTGLQQLFDGDLTTDVQTGYGKIIEPYEAYYPIQPGEFMQIDSIRMFDWQGNSTVPMELYLIDSNWNRKRIAGFTGSQYNQWVGPYPERTGTIRLDTAVRNIRYLMIRTGDLYPTELEYYGYYKSPSVVTATVRDKIPMSQYFGVNAYEWDFSDGATDPYRIDSGRYAAVKNFTAVRHYMDWQKLENTAGSYTYSPTRMGGWNYDTIYQQSKKDGITMLACLKTIPDWMQATYPDSLRDAENTPVKYGADFTDPSSYTGQARAAFQYIARYGNNRLVDPALLSVNGTPRWSGDPVNTVRIGLGLIQYIECDNERDKWWKGRKGYQTGREYAANLSAFYDGHKNTLGAGVGVKNADSSVKVVMAGTALANTDYFRGMIDWCKEYRGYKPDGSVNICWDVINYHIYTIDTAKQRGVAPEKMTTSGRADSLATAFIQAAHQYLNGMPVWITETGYDIHPQSPGKVIAIGNKTALETQGDWILRTALMYARTGINKVFFYQLRDDAPAYGGLYATSGLINENGTRRPAADYIRQVNQQFGQYSYNKTLSTDPQVDQYVYNDSVQMHVLYIPDETGRTGTYTLDLGTADSAYIYTPTIGSDTLALARQKTNAGKITLTLTETPVFVTGKGIGGDTTVQPPPVTGSIRLYPNPATSTVTLSGLTPGVKTKIRLYSVDGRILQTAESSAAQHILHITSLPPELYFIQVHTGSSRSVLAFIKGK